MHFKNIIPIAPLQKYIEKMWVFETSGRMPVDDLKLVVPNANIKLTVAYCNGIVAEMNGQTFSAKEGSITLTGLVDVPVILDADENVATGTLCAEFSPLGAYRFFRLPLNAIKNQIRPLHDILDSSAKQVEEQIANVKNIEDKVTLFQQFLLKQFLLHEEDSIFEYCVEKINSSKGRITVKELEKKTGYSSRWLNMKFEGKLGVSPKNLAAIIRFKQYYQAFANNNESAFFENDFYDYYYDQSHFLKDFKRFTGLSHKGFQNHDNGFGKLLYKE